VHGFGINKRIHYVVPGEEKTRLRLPLQISEERTFVFQGGFYSSWLVQPSLSCASGVLSKSRSWLDANTVPYWATEESLRAWQLAKTSFFVPDLQTYPFAYPELTEEDEKGEQTLHIIQTVFSPILICT
jgi:hypothetical protein